MQFRQTSKSIRKSLYGTGIRPSTPFSLDTFLEKGYEPSYSPFDPIEPDYRYRLLLQVLPRVMDGELTDIQHRCILMHYYGNYSVSEIAKSLGVSPSTVTKHLQKAVERLNKVLGYLFAQ